MIESYIEKKENPKWDQEIELAKTAINAVNRMNPKPKFFIVCGDLVNAFPGTELNKPQITDFKDVFKGIKSEVPLICVCGNHDVGDVPTNQSIAEYNKEFGDDYFVFWHSAVMFIVLNSQFYENRELVQDLAEKQDKWLDDMLEDAKSGNYKHIVIFQHIPWFLNDPFEEKEYFNVENELRLKMLDKFYSAGVRAIFCGHFHRNAGGFYKDLEHVTTSAIGCQLGSDFSGLRIVKVYEDSIKHTYYGLSEIPENIIL